MTQPQFNFARQADRSRATQYRDCVMDLLSDGAWHRAKAICQQLPGLNDRALREVAELSEGRIISTNAGYKLVDHATPAEIAEYEDRQLSQIRHTKARLTRTLKRWHQANRGAA